MPTTDEIIAYVQEFSGHHLNADEGVHCGPHPRHFSTAVVAWMASPDALARAAAAKAELLIVHESIFYPYCAEINTNNPPGWEEWLPNRQRRVLAADAGLSIMRIHHSADEIAVYDEFARQLGLHKPVAADNPVGKIFEEPLATVGEWIDRVKAATGLRHLRVSAPRGLAQRVRRIALPWGGLGLFVNVGYQAAFCAKGVDLFIAGESDSYGFRFAAEAGIAMIETSHECSENPGLARFTAMLAEKFPSARFVFHTCPTVWESV